MRERMRRFDGLMTGTGPTGSLSPGLLPPAERAIGRDVHPQVETQTDRVGFSCT